MPSATSRRDPPVSIAGILFDKDGTLLDYAASWTPINRRAAAIAARGDPALAARLLQLGGADPVSGRVAPDSLLASGNTAELAEVWVAGGAPHDRGGLTRMLDELFRASVADMVPVTDLAALFSRLRGHGLKLGIASSDNEASVRATAARFGIDGLIDYVAGYDSGFGTKPAPGMVEGFCRVAQLSPAEVAVVGDNTHDMLMGRAAAVGFIVGVLTGNGTRETLAPHADICLESIEALEAALYG
ncbi:HAD family hydrolase [Chelatococcus sp. SYSU_G07232]|uniref:phosphoglycolate phosphatase n=1 Tax=Chelatococcus albus TaxID=3047466 RepID=A0ABT7AFE7_9HYPH|nr:HAD family hydrolase [Chelatococcus sp. SYSU_G07232]MDJ1158082.1 HAD family hydrolase [Chelatococcus sp. SYSU_G07232]